MTDTVRTEDTSFSLAEERGRVLGDMLDGNLVRQVLADVYDKRRQKNPSYSKRAFARDLEVDCADLSKALRGKKRLASKTVARLCKKLALSRAQTQFLVACTLLGTDR